MLGEKTNSPDGEHWLLSNLRRRLVIAAFSHDSQVKAYVSSQVVCVSVEEGELIWAKGQLLHRAAKVNRIVQQFGL